MAYGSPGPHEWVQPIRKGYRLACCDCGAVHAVFYRVVKRHIQVRYVRLVQATADRRRRKPDLPCRRKVVR